jgi:hypothetical protein
MRLLTAVLVLCLIVFSFQQEPIGCLIWRNSYISITKEKNSILSINVKSRQKTGWMAMAALEKPDQFENSISVLAYFPYNIVQLTNHTVIENKKTIFEEYFDNAANNQLDGILSFFFKINSSKLSGKNYFYFAQNDFNSPIKINETIQIPRHNRYSKFYYFLLNNTKEPLECYSELNFSGRFSAWSLETFLPTCFFYLFVLILMLAFRNHQPFKSRFIGPFIFLFGMYANLVGEFFFSLVTYEVTDKLYCYITGFNLYLSFQIA